MYHVIAQYLHNAWKRHQDAVYWVDINLAIEQGLTFYQTRSNAIIFQETLPAYCIPKVVRMETGEVLIRKSKHVTSTYAKDLIEARMEKRIAFGSCSTSRRRRCSTTRRRRCTTRNIFPTNPNQFQIQFVKDRGDVITCKMEETRPVLRRSMQILFCEELSSSERTVRPVETVVIQTRSSEDRKSLHVEQTHERTERPVATFDTADAKDSSRIRSSHESDTFNVEDEELRKRME